MPALAGVLSVQLGQLDPCQGFADVLLVLLGHLDPCQGLAALKLVHAGSPRLPHLRSRPPFVLAKIEALGHTAVAIPAICCTEILPGLDRVELRRSLLGTWLWATTGPGGKVLLLAILARCKDTA